MTGDELSRFHRHLVFSTLASGLAPHYTVQRMKELWFYMGFLFPGAEKALKTILHSRSLSDYDTAVSSLFSSCEPDPDASFRQ